MVFIQGIKRPGTFFFTLKYEASDKKKNNFSLKYHFKPLINT